MPKGGDITRFTKGASQKTTGRRGGRAKGTPNKITGTAKECLQLAFEGLGGVPSLIQFGKMYPKTFYTIWSKLVPVEVNGKGGGAVHVYIDGKEQNL
jgi:hypothetical protein